MDVVLITCVLYSVSLDWCDGVVQRTSEARSVRLVHDTPRVSCCC